MIIENNQQLCGIKTIIMFIFVYKYINSKLSFILKHLAVAVDLNWSFQKSHVNFFQNMHFIVANASLKVEL